MEANAAEDRARRGRLVFILAMLFLSLALLSDPPARQQQQSQQTFADDPPEPKNLHPEENTPVISDLISSPYTFPDNVTHNFRGDWELIPAGSKHGRPSSPNVSIIPSMLNIRPQKLLFQQHTGALVIQLKSFKSNANGVHLLAGSYHIADGDVGTNRDLMGTLSGVYLESAGLLGFGTSGTLSGLHIRWFSPNDTGGNTPPSGLYDDEAPPSSQPPVNDDGSNGTATPRLAREHYVSTEDLSSVSSSHGWFDAVTSSSVWNRLFFPASASTAQPPSPRNLWSVRYDGVDSTRCTLWAEFQIAPVAAKGPSNSSSRRLAAPDTSPGQGVLAVVEDSDVNREYRNRNPDVDPPVLLPMVGVAYSPNCGFRMNITASVLIVDLPLVEEKTMQYSMLMTLCIVLQMVSLIKQLTESTTIAAAARISLLTVGMQAVLDSYICLLHVVAGIVWDTLFNSFATISFSELMLFSILEMRLMLSIWKARRAEAFANGWNETRRQLGILYARFYGGLILGMFLMYQLWMIMPVLLFLWYSFWVPQIIHSAHQDTTDGLSNVYLITTSITRLVLPFYFLGYSRSFLQYLHPTEPQESMCLALAVWVMLQLVMIAMQRKFGPRFFIPARFLPQKYDYYRPVLVVDGHVQVDPNGTTGTRARPISSTTRSGYTSLPATINRFTASVRSAVGDCLFRFRNTRSSGDTQGAFASVRPDDDDSDAVDVHDPEAAPSTPGGRSNGRRMVVPASAPAAGVDVTDMPSITLTPPAAGEGAPALGSIDCVICMTEVTVSDRDYMVTPCLHLFHEACLQQWMDVKMECPTCRTVLPPP